MIKKKAKTFVIALLFPALAALLGMPWFVVVGILGAAIVAATIVELCWPAENY